MAFATPRHYPPFLPLPQHARRNSRTIRPEVIEMLWAQFVSASIHSPSRPDTPDAGSRIRYWRHLSVRSSHLGQPDGWTNTANLLRFMPDAT